MNWHERFDRLLKAMALGEPHKAERRAGSHSPPDDRATPPASEEDGADIEAPRDRGR